jgi:hypothetical protein
MGMLAEITSSIDSGKGHDVVYKLATKKGAFWERGLI